LDLGCGNGALAGKLLNEGFNVYGIDASTSGIDIARRMHGEDRFFLVDIAHKTLPEAIRSYKFDAVISTEVIEHIYSPKSYMQFCRNILEDSQGILILSTPYHGYLKNLALALSGHLDSHFTALWEGGHIKFFSSKTIRKLFEANGFNCLGIYGAGRIPYLWKSMVVVGKFQPA
ncbi:MAG: class I SAM-dependent methyltransferase, partial [Thermoanaerobaculia bacterium]|nr:class I SAM-dependent methyltransferase [Thermoanaerobaculia bacterium]